MAAPPSTARPSRHAHNKLKERVREAAKSSAREGILLAAEAAFVADGVAGTSMQSIAQRAGTSVGTLYNYFEDRDDLVRALFEDRRARLGDGVDAALAATAAQPFAAQLEAFVRTVLAHFDEHRAFLAIALGNEMVALKKKNASTFLRDRTRALIARGVADGVLEPARAPLATASLSGILRTLLIDGVDDSGAFVRHVDDVVALFLHGAARRRA